MVSPGRSGILRPSTCSRIQDCSSETCSVSMERSRLSIARVHLALRSACRLPSSFFRRRVSMDDMLSTLRAGGRTTRAGSWVGEPTPSGWQQIAAARTRYRGYRMGVIDVDLGDGGREYGRCSAFDVAKDH